MTRRELVLTFFKHPATGMAIGIIGIMVAILMFMLSREVKQPVFAVSPPELIAQSIHEGEKLKILWENKEVMNVASVKIALWNNGSRFIDKNDISNMNPIRITSIEKVNILAVEVLKTSRPTLQFDTNIERDANGIESLTIKIKGDEALEKYDGAIFHVLFSGSLENTWKVIGRIKGVLKGFQPKDWKKVYRQKHSPRLWPIILGAMLFLGSIGLWIIEYVQAKRLGRKREWPSLLFLNGFFLFLFVVLTIREYWDVFGPSWLLW